MISTKRAVSAMDLIKACVDEAAEMGCARMSSSRVPTPAMRTVLAPWTLWPPLRTLCAYADDKGLALAVETFDRDVDKNTARSVGSLR